MRGSGGLDKILAVGRLALPQKEKGGTLGLMVVRARSFADFVRSG